MTNWPVWWSWELELTPHVLKRMVDRSFTEVDLRQMLEDAYHDADDVNRRASLLGIADLPSDDTAALHQVEKFAWGSVHHEFAERGQPDLHPLTDRQALRDPRDDDSASYPAARSR